MHISWLGALMMACWALTLLGGLGMHVLSNFNGRRLEAYCRLKRNYGRFGEILDHHEDVSTAAQYVLFFGLVVGSLAAGAWFSTNGKLEVHASQLTWNTSPLTLVGWIFSWLFLLTLAGLWLPRTAIRYSSPPFLFHSWPLWKLLAVLLWPISNLGNVFSWLGHRLSDEPEGEELDESVLEDEIRTMVVSGQRDGYFAQGVPEMIQGVMDLDENDVEEIMTPRSLVDAVDVSLPWEEVVKTVVACGRTRIPVFRETMDNIIGILFVKDLLSVIASPDFQPAPNSLESILRKAWFIPSNKRVDQLLRVFLHNRNHMAIVIDEYRQFMGVVTIEDALEEIVGEISDELDTDEESQIHYDEKSHQLEAEGKVPVEDVSKFLGVELPESDDYDTVGGLVIHRLSRIPTQGTSIEIAGVRVTVLKATRRSVQRVRLELVEGGSEREGN